MSTETRSERFIDELVAHRRLTTDEANALSGVIRADIAAAYKEGTAIRSKPCAEVLAAGMQAGMRTSAERMTEREGLEHTMRPCGCDRLAAALSTFRNHAEQLLGGE